MFNFGSGLRSFGGEVRLAFPFIFVVAAEFEEEAFGGAHGIVGAELGGWGEGAVGGVVNDFVDGFGGTSLGIGLGEVDAGDLKAVEEDSGAARVERAGGEVLEDEADGELDGGAVLGEREAEQPTGAVPA